MRQLVVEVYVGEVSSIEPEVVLFLISKAITLRFLRPAARMLLVKLLAMCKSYDAKTNELIIHAFPKKVTEELGITRRYYSFLIDELKEHDLIQVLNYGSQHVVYRLRRRHIEENVIDQTAPSKIFSADDSDTYRNA